MNVERLFGVLQLQMKSGRIERREGNWDTALGKVNGVIL